MRRRVGICIWLKVNDEFVRLIIFDGTFHALLYLFPNCGQFAGELWRERIDVAIGTTAITFAPIAIRAGKASVSNDLVYLLTVVLIPQVSTVMIVILMPEI